LVLSLSLVSRWVEALLTLPNTPAVLDAVVQMGRQTGDTARDLPPATLEMIRRACEKSPRAANQLAGVSDDLASSSRVFGEELPAGLVLAGSAVE
jgi:hypothetical protein